MYLNIIYAINFNCSTIWEDMEINSNLNRFKQYRLKFVMKIVVTLSKYVFCCCISALVLISPDDESSYIFLTRKNCCEFLGSYGIIFQSVIQSGEKGVHAILSSVLTKIHPLFQIFCS